MADIDRNYGGASNSQYPSDLNTDKDGFVEFQVKSFRGRTTNFRSNVKLYVPAGIVKTDGVTYENSALKAAGVFKDAITSNDGNALGTMVGNATQGLTLAERIIQRSIVRAGIATASRVIQNDILDEDAALSARDLALGQAINPNIKATLDRINPRAIQFQFQFIPTSKEEAQSIHEIIQVFRTTMYPEFGAEGEAAVTDQLFLRYPDVFEINVYPAGGATEDIHVVKFKDSFLTSVSVEHNPTASTYHKDGAPVETQISLQFIEAETPTKADIVEGGF